MTRACTVLAALLLAATVGCSAVPGHTGTAPESAQSFSPLARVVVGMSAAQAEAIAGTPVSKEQKGDHGRREVWHYADGCLILRDARVAFNFPVTQPPGGSSPGGRDSGGGLDGP
jgi:hypothetical protein